MAWVLATVALSLGQVVPDGARVVWELRFDRPGDEQGLEFNGEIISRQATAEGLVMETSGSDPIIHLPEISLATSPYQALEITYECPQTAQGELFYAHDRNTEYRWLQWHQAHRARVHEDGRPRNDDALALLARGTRADPAAAGPPE